MLCFLLFIFSGCATRDRDRKLGRYDSCKRQLNHLINSALTHIGTPHPFKLDSSCSESKKFRSYKHNLTLKVMREETPIEITETPIMTLKTNVNDVSKELIKTGFVEIKAANEIQKRMKTTKIISKAYHSFECQDMSKDFFKLRAFDRSLDNFWNKIIKRKAVLVKGQRTGDEVEFNIKQIEGLMKKRWGKFSLKSESPEKWQSKVLEIAFIDAMNKTEVEDMFLRVEERFQDRVHF